MTTIAQYFNILKKAGNDFIDDGATKFSASLAYYTVFAIGPLLLVILTVIGFFFKSDSFAIQFRQQFQTLIGVQGTDEIFSIIDNIRSQHNTKLFGIIGVVVLLFAATGIFTEIQSSINYIWSIRAKPKKSWLKYLTDRLISMSLLVGLGFLLVVTLFVNTVLDLLTTRLQYTFGSVNAIVFHALSIILLFAIICCLFAVVYKVLPDATIHWKDAFAGAIFTSILFMIGKSLIGYYLGTSQISNTYGAAASIIILLSWVYYSAIILYFGAEFTKEYTRQVGHGIEPYRDAVFIIKQEAKELPNSSGRE